MPSYMSRTGIDAATGTDDRVARIMELVPTLPADIAMAVYGPDTPANTYVLVDATLRTNVTGVFDLDVVGPAAQCLFDGRAAEDYGDAAPWLVDISIADPDRADLAFHRDFFASHWQAKGSVIIQTDATLDVLRRHLRRFVQLPVRDDGKRLYFRFWDPRVLPDFLQAIAADVARVRRMMMTDAGQPLRYLVNADDAPVLLSPDAEALAAVQVTPMFLTYADFDPLARARENARHARIAARIAADFPNELAGRPQTEVEALVREAVTRFGGYGFREHAHLHFFAVWTVLYGLGFEQADRTGRLQEICRLDAPEKERFKAFRAWFDTFEVAA